MLSRVGSQSTLLICTDCGTPVPMKRDRNSPHPLSSSLLLLGMGAFALLLFFLTNWRPLQPQHAGERSRIKLITTGQFLRDPEPLEKASHNDEPGAEGEAELP